MRQNLDMWVGKTQGEGRCEWVGRGVLGAEQGQGWEDKTVPWVQDRAKDGKKMGCAGHRAESNVGSRTQWLQPNDPESCPTREGKCCPEEPWTAAVLRTVWGRGGVKWGWEHPAHGILQNIFLFPPPFLFGPQNYLKAYIIPTFQAIGCSKIIFMISNLVPLD